MPSSDEKALEQRLKALEQRLQQVEQQLNTYARHGLTVLTFKDESQVWAAKDHTHP